MSWETFEATRDDGPSWAGARWVGEAIRRRRWELVMSQRELEARSGVDQTVISRLENGRLKAFRFGQFLALVGALGGLSFDPLPCDDLHPCRWREIHDLDWRMRHQS